MAPDKRTISVRNEIRVHLRKSAVKLLLVLVFRWCSEACP